MGSSLNSFRRYYWSALRGNTEGGLDDDEYLDFNAFAKYDQIAQRYSIFPDEVPRRMTSMQINRVMIMLLEEGNLQREKMKT